MTGNTLLGVEAFASLILAVGTLVAMEARWRNTALVLGMLLLLDLLAAYITLGVTR